MPDQQPEPSKATVTRADDMVSGPVGSPPSPRTKADQLSPQDKHLRDRLDKVQLWLRTAKENLPDLNNGCVPADRVASASALVDRLHRLAAEAAASGTSRARRSRHAA